VIDKLRHNFPKMTSKRVGDEEFKTYIIEKLNELLMPLPSVTGSVMLTSDLTLVAARDIAEGIRLTAIPCSLRNNIYLTAKEEYEMDYPILYKPPDFFVPVKKCVPSAGLGSFVTWVKRTSDKHTTNCEVVLFEDEFYLKSTCSITAETLLRCVYTDMIKFLPDIETEQSSDLKKNLHSSPIIMF